MKPPDPSRPETPEEAQTRIGWRMAGLGMEVASQVGAGALIGWVIDLLRGHGKTWLLVGAITGIVVGLWSLVHGTLKLNKQLEREAPIKNIKPLPTKITKLPKRDEIDSDDDDDDFPDLPDTQSDLAKLKEDLARLQEVNDEALNKDEDDTDDDHAPPRRPTT